MFQKSIKAILVLSLLFLMTGCSWKNEPLVKEQGNSEQESYVYKNADLGFTITLPKDFNHYEVQRKNLGDKTDVEFYVLTSDQTFVTDFKGFGKIMTIRVASNEAGSDGFVNLTKTKDKFYFVKFWEAAPEDWKERFNNEFKKELTSSFKLND